MASIASVVSWANQQKNLGCTIDCVGFRRPHGIFSDLLPDNRIRYIQKDLSKPFEIKGQYDFIIHAAGYAQPAKFLENPFETVTVNVFATRNLLEAARRSGARFLFFSSAEIYGEIPQKEMPAKQAAEANIRGIGQKVLSAPARREEENIKRMQQLKHRQTAGVRR